MSAVIAVKIDDNCGISVYVVGRGAQVVENGRKKTKTKKKKDLRRLIGDDDTSGGELMKVAIGNYHLR